MWVKLWSDVEIIYNNHAVIKQVLEGKVSKSQSVDF
jgi:hypothetical protein